MTTISPELALVDPELAASARAALYEPGQFFPASGTQISLAKSLRPPIATAAPIETATSASQERRPSPRLEPNRRRPRRVLAVGACAALAVPFLLAAGWHRSAPPRIASAPVRQLVDHARAIQDAHQAGTYTWPAVPGARAYQVVISRGRIPVYETTTSKATVTLPTALRFEPGRYAWSASPILRGENAPARPVVESSFTVAG
jgi:hypothetical protein